MNVKTFHTSEGVITATRTGKGALRYGDKYTLALDGQEQAVLIFESTGRWGTYVLNPHCPEEYRSSPYNGNLKDAAIEVALAAASWRPKPEVTEITLTPEQAEQVINNDPAPTGRHLRALVTIETTERLATRAFKALDQAREDFATGASPMESIHLAQALLSELVDATSLTTISQVKDQATSDEIAVDARERVRKIVERVS